MITTFTGPMHSSKSEGIIDVYNKIYNKDNILVFKPKIDVRELGYIKSKGSDKVMSSPCNKDKEIGNEEENIYDADGRGGRHNA